MEQDIVEYVDQIKREQDYFGKSKLVNFLIHQKHIKVKDLAEALGMKPSYLCHIMRLHRLSEIIMDGYYSKLISMSHLFVLSLLKSNEDIMTVYEVVLRDGLTVLQTEELVREKLHGIKPGGSYVDKSTVDSLQLTVKKQFNAEMKMTQTRIKTKILIEWKGSREERRRAVERFLQMIESQ
jgi:ParB family chromosome partitioning protein